MYAESNILIPNNDVSSNKIEPAKKTTKLYYKPGELKMEKIPNKKHGNIVLYYKNGAVLFDGTINSGSLVEEGSWYYPNNQLYYCGHFNKLGIPEGVNCTLYHENSEKKYQGSIFKSFIQVLVPSEKMSDSAKSFEDKEKKLKSKVKDINNTQKLNYKIDTGI